MNREEKAAVVAELSERLKEADAIFAIDYRGISVGGAAELRSRLADAGAAFKVVKNRLAKRAAADAGAEELDELLVGPTALTLIKGDAVIAAKAISSFGREHELLEFKGGLMDGEALDPDGFQAIARLPGLDVLHGQLVGVAASPITGLARGLGSMLSGLAIALGQISEQGLLGAEAEPGAEAEAEGEEAPAGEETSEEEKADGAEAAPADEAEGSDEGSEGAEASADPESEESSG